MLGSDKRRHPRFDGAQLQARLKIDGSCHPSAMVENVSLGGALVGLAGSPLGPGKNVLLELRSGARHIRMVGRVIDALPRGRGRSLPAVRIRFNPLSAAVTAELYALIRALPKDDELAASPTDPEAFEFHTLTLSDDEPQTELAIDIDIEEDEVELELKDAIDDEPTLIDAMAQELETKAMRIEELERQLSSVKRNARTIEELFLPLVG